MFILAHLSDPHLAPLPPPRPARALVQARARLHQLAAQAPLASTAPTCWRRSCADLKAHAPDHIAVTGDLVNLSLDSEFAPARAWLDALGRSARCHLGARQSRRLCARGRRHSRRGTGATFMRGDAGESFPFVRRRGPVALIGLSTSLPTLPLAATGRLHGDQLARLGELLAKLEREAAVPRRADPSSAGRQARNYFRRLTDAGALRDGAAPSTAPSWCCTATTTRHRCTGCRAAGPHPGGRRAVGLGRAGRATTSRPATISMRSRARRARGAAP